MRLFGGIISTFKKSEAAIVVQNLLSHQAKIGLFAKDPAEIATILISNVWNAKPDIFNGKFGKRPHKLSTAAAALSREIAGMDFDHPDFASFQICLGNILREYDTNGGLYSLSNIDHSLLKVALETLISKSEQLESDNSSFLNEMRGGGLLKEKNIPSQGIVYMETQKYLTFEDWLTAYNQAAMDVNESLEPNDGLSLLDLLDNKPLVQAYDDLVDPIFLGEHFGKNFNPLDIGFQ